MRAPSAAGRQWPLPIGPVIRVPNIVHDSDNVQKIGSVFVGREVDPFEMSALRAVVRLTLRDDVVRRGGITTM